MGVEGHRGLRYVIARISVDERATLIEGVATDGLTKWNVPLVQIGAETALETGGFVVGGLGFQDAITNSVGREVISERLLGRDFRSDVISVPHVEQSNSSLVVDRVAFVKLYRVLRESSRREVAIYRALSRHGATGVATLLGDAELFGSPSAIALSYVESDGDLYGLLRRARKEGFPRLRIISMMEEVGAALATLHRDLAQSLGTADSRASSALASDAIERCKGVWEKVGNAAPGLASRGHEVIRVQQSMSRADGTDPLVVLQVIHGDLHLGQVLPTASGMCFLDFEGEAFEVSSSVLALAPREYDLAGILRSIAYLTYGDADRSDDLDYRHAFLHGYRSSREVDEIDPHLLAVSEIEKATYELLYEINAARGLVEVPLAFLEEITSKRGVGYDQ
jgi:predicted trehalose synthase